MQSLRPFVLGLATAIFALLAGCGPDYPNCDVDGDCHEGELCVNGQCQQCRDDSDCPAGQGCNAGRCDPIPGYCGSSQDCPPGQECQNNRCTASGDQTFTPTETPAATGPCELGAVYFAFDADNLDDRARSAIQTNVDCMRSRSMAGLQLTGHCDPRGTEEYNLALGDRRARAVKDYLASLGVDGGQLGVGSMGEEMARGTDESSWTLDRRVDFAQR